MLIVKCLRKFSQMLENETIVSMKSRFFAFEFILRLK